MVSRSKQLSGDRTSIDLAYVAALYDASPLAMAAVNGVDHIIYHVNPAFCRLMGKNKGQLIGHSFGEAVPEASGGISVLDRVSRTRKAEAYAGTEHSGSDSKNCSYLVWSVVAPNNLAPGLMIHAMERTDPPLLTDAVAMNEELLLATVRQHEKTEAAEGVNRRLEADITERKELEKELRKSRDELEVRVEERTRELRAINEELRIENEERLKVEIDLRESETRLRQLSAELLNAQEKERRVVAQEIHDSIGSSLAAAKFKIETVSGQVSGNRPEIGAALKSIIPIIQRAIDEARRIQAALRPSILDDFGIVATLNWYCREFETTYPSVHISKSVQIEEYEIPDHLKTVIYRVCQEALNNVAKHSKAERVFLSLMKSDEGIQLAIEDNGGGFEPAETRPRTGENRGLGLDSMRERVELSEGSYSLESKRGVGTVVRASWPFHRQTQG